MVSSLKGHRENSWAVSRLTFSDRMIHEQWNSKKVMLYLKYIWLLNQVIKLTYLTEVMIIVQRFYQSTYFVILTVNTGLILCVWPSASPAYFCKCNTTGGNII